MVKWERERWSVGNPPGEEGKRSTWDGGSEIMRVDTAAVGAESAAVERGERLGLG